MGTATAGPAAPHAPFTPNYAHSPGIQHLLHWERMPLRVWFFPDREATQPRRAAAQEGFDEWVRATRGVIRYQLVGAFPNADVVVTFLSTDSLPGQRNVSGSSVLRSSDAVLQKASIALATGQATDEQLQATAAHEFGHVLGIEGHSDDPDDLMYPVETRRERPTGERIGDAPPSVTVRDLNTLKTCYSPLFTLPPPAQR